MDCMGHIGLASSATDLVVTGRGAGVIEVENAGGELGVLEYLKRQMAGTLRPGDHTSMRYPTAISALLGFTLVEVGSGRAVVAVDADPTRHGNQQGTVHGGLMVELADAAIGTAHSTVIGAGESFTTIDLTATFLRPVWAARLSATADRVHEGRTINHYLCEVTRDDGKPVARISSAVMTLRGEKAVGR